MRLEGINKPIDSTIEDEELEEKRRIERMTPEEYDAYLVAKYGIDGAWLIKHEVDGGRTEASSILPSSDEDETPPLSTSEYEALYGSNEPNPFVESTKPVSKEDLLEDLYSNLDDPKEDYDFGFDWDEKPKKNGPKM